jgi:cyclophilin family peptidyl-prolyl cis-trans isomerase
MRFCLRALVLGSLLIAVLQPAAAAPVYVRFNTSLGNINVQLVPDVAPLNVANFLSYVDSGAYTNTFFHRSVPNFIIQGGGYGVNLSTGNLTSVAANAPVAGEHDPTNNPNALSNVRGTLALALSTGPNSGTNEWFFNEVDNSSTLDGTGDGGPFTAFGTVADANSLSVMDSISAVPIPALASNPLVTISDYAGTSTPDENPDDYTFGNIPLLNYTAGNQLLISNLVFVNSISEDYGSWQIVKFSSSALNASATGINFHDGVPNLTKYLCHIDPTRPMTGSDIQRLPTLGSTKSGNTVLTTLTYHQFLGLLNVTVNVQTSSDLQTWTPVSNPTITQTGTDAAGDPIMQVQLASTPGTPQFVRLNLVVQ